MRRAWPSASSIESITEVMSASLTGRLSTKAVGLPTELGGLEGPHVLSESRRGRCRKPSMTTVKPVPAVITAPAMRATYISVRLARGALS